MKTESYILYENGDFWVSDATFGTGNFKPKTEGFQVWECTITHSKLRGSFGFAGEKGLAMAKAYADKLATSVK